MILKKDPYQLINKILFSKNSDGVFLRCLEKYEIETVLKELHYGPTGGHFGGETIVHKILRFGYYLITLFRYYYSYVKKFQDY